MNRDPGVDVDHVVAARVSLPGARYPNSDDAVGSTKGSCVSSPCCPVATAAATSYLPAGGGGFGLGRVFLNEGQPEPPAITDYAANWNVVTPDYFRTLGIPPPEAAPSRIATPTSPPVVVVNETFARRCSPPAMPSATASARGATKISCAKLSAWSPTSVTRAGRHRLRARVRAASPERLGELCGRRANDGQSRGVRASAARDVAPLDPTRRGPPRHARAVRASVGRAGAIERGARSPRSRRWPWSWRRLGFTASWRTSSRGEAGSSACGLRSAPRRVRSSRKSPAAG